MNVSRNVSPVSLFLTFAPGDKRLLTRKAEGLPGGELDHPLFRYCIAIHSRLVSFEHVVSQIEVWHSRAIEDMIEVGRTGSGSIRSGTVLVYYFESLADTIYKSMESIARMNLFIYPTKKNPPHGFTDQIKSIKKIHPESHLFSKSYDSAAIGHLEFYEKVNRIRRNSTHFMGGIEVFDQGEDGLLIPLYFNFELSMRGRKAPDSKMILRIADETKSLKEGYQSWLNDIFSAYLDELDEETQGIVMFRSPEAVEHRSFTMKEFLSGGEGRVVHVTSIRKVGKS
jgi:hypothetical protein